MAFGNPAKVVRQLTEEEVEDNRHNAEHYVDLILENILHSNDRSTEDH